VGRREENGLMEVAGASSYCASLAEPRGAIDRKRSLMVPAHSSEPLLSQFLWRVENRKKPEESRENGEKEPITQLESPTLSEVSGNLSSNLGEGRLLTCQLLAINLRGKRSFVRPFLLQSDTFIIYNGHAQPS